MAACAAGDLCARAMDGARMPAFAASLSPARREDKPLMVELLGRCSRGVL
jgi:hypothetical protein